MVASQATVDAADFWHVALAPGETKVLTLEQLDDLFRLDIIDAATRVWQPGMSDWLPLSVVAGLEAEPPKPKVAPPAPPSSRAPARAPSPPQRPVATASFGAAPPVSFQPSAPTRPIAAAAPLAAPWPGKAAPTHSVRPIPESFRPIVVSHRPLPAPSGGGAGGRFVLALALIAGVGVTLYRNDILRQAAVSAGKEATYLKVEAALGGPGFGTPRAVQLAAPASLSAAVAAAGVQTSSPQSTQARSVASPVAEKPATNSASAPSPVSLSSLVSAQLTGPKAKAERAAPPAAARPAARPASGSAQPARGLGIKGSSNALDPLNGKL